MKQMSARNCSRAMLPCQTTILVTLFSLTFAYRADFQPPQGQLNRRFFWSSDAPLTEAINELAPAAIPHFEFAIRHFARMEAAVLNSLNRTRVLHDDPIKTCDPTIDPKYRMALLRYFALVGIPEPAWNCGTDIVGVDIGGEPPGYTLDDIYNAVFQQGVEVQKRVREIAARVIDNFTTPSVPFNFSYSTRSARCVLSPVCMVRVGENWHQSFGISSNGLEEHLIDESRQRVTEFFRVVDGRLGENLLLRLPVYDNGSIERVFQDNTTTMIQRWAGIPSSSCFRRIPIDVNPAMVDALNRVDHSSQQAEDAVTSSNLAILILPLGLNMIPIAFFATVDTKVMLLYTLLSDVLTTIPLAIKGLELVVISSTRYRSVVTRVLSPITGNLTIPVTAGGGIWGAECRVREEVGRTGIVLLVMAAVMLVVGISGELLARKHVMNKHARQNAALLEGSFDYSEGDSLAEGFHSADVGVIGSKYERYSDYDKEE